MNVENSEIYVTQFTTQNQESGKQLAARYCATCHGLPDPISLDKETWKNSVLPNMGRRLGLKLQGKLWDDELDPTEAVIVSKMNLYPKTPIISKRDWNLLSEYYVTNAPEKLSSPSEAKSIKSIKFPFKVESISIDNAILPQITLLKYFKEKKQLFIGDNLNLFQMDIAGTSEQKWQIKSPASDVEFLKGEEPLLLTIGSLAPSDKKLGKIISLDKNEDFKNFPDLKRPVDFEFEDLNADGELDLILSQYGHYGGRLSWFDQMDAKQEYILSTLPGTRKVEIKDLNFDGKPDIIALMAQARERIVLFVNKGNNEFEEKILLEFPAVNGTNYFELADFNNDGFLDIMVTNGDNRDYSNISKPYHGIRIYLNNGKNIFEQKYFFPMYDCSKAMVNDFDNDGDLDLFAISLFGNYSDNKNIRNSIVYLENDGHMNFSASNTPICTHGNWLSMEIGDFNNDNLPDVMVGAFVFDLKEAMKIAQKTGNAEIPQLLLFTQLKEE